MRIAFLLCVLALSVMAPALATGVAAPDAAEDGGILPAPAVTVPGFYRGAGYVMVRGADGDSRAQDTEIAECTLSSDGRFRFATAPGAQGESLWTRGTWRPRGTESDGSEWLELSCLDIGGVLIGRCDEKGLILVYQPKPLRERRFRLDRTGAPPAPGSGWPSRAEYPDGAPGMGGVYIGRMTGPAANGTPAKFGEGILVVSADGRMEGTMRVPLAAGYQPVLAPFLGQWRKPAVGGLAALSTEGEHLLSWSWGQIRPANGWERPSLSVTLDPDGRQMTARASLAGMPLDQTVWRRIPAVRVSQSADAADLELCPTGNLDFFRLSGISGAAGESVYGLLHFISQSGTTLAGNPARFFPLRLDPANRRLLMRSPDDPEGWMAFSLDCTPDGRLVVNRDGKDGTLVRLGNGGVGAFVVRTPPAAEGFAFPSTRNGDTLVLTLDLTIAPLTPGKIGDLRRDRVIVVARRVDDGA